MIPGSRGGSLDYHTPLWIIWQMICSSDGQSLGGGWQADVKSPAAAGPLPTPAGDGLGMGSWSCTRACAVGDTAAERLAGREGYCEKRRHC